MIDPKTFEDLIDKIVNLDHFAGPDSPSRKIEFLCFALEELKFARGGETDEVRFEEYVQSDVRISGSKLLVSAPSKVGDVGSGTGKKKGDGLLCCGPYGADLE